MARHSVVSSLALDEPCILAPERYDPRRRLDASGCALPDIAEIVTENLRPGAGDARCLVLDTTHAVEGLVRTRRGVVPAHGVRSAKRVVQPGDVMISRLRPYLRQVAWIDPAIALRGDMLLASTEFYVLRSVDERSIAFLVPFLLSARVQAALAAAQEGGHHPRVPRSFLRGLAVPEALIEGRDRASATVEAAAQSVRRAESKLAALVTGANAALGEPG